MKKPTIYIPCNFGGGARKSTTTSYLYYSLVEDGNDPIVVALDTNEELLKRIPKNVKVVTWDINSEEDSAGYFAEVLKLAHNEDRPIIIDLPARGGKTKGIFTLLRTRLLQYCHVIGVAPVKPSDKDCSKAIEALVVIQPNTWFLVQYDSSERSATYQNIAQFQALVAMKPAAVIKPDELTNQEAGLLVKEDISLPEAAVKMSENPFGNPHLSVFAEFWKRIYPQFQKAIKDTKP